MSAFHQHNIVRLNQNANLTTNQRGRGPLGFLKRGRTNNNVAAVVRRQAPLPAESLAPPPPDAVQSRQWHVYPHGRPMGRSNNTSTTSELGTHNSTRLELDALRPRMELDATRGPFQLEGGQGSFHSNSPISPLSQVTNASRSQDSTNTGIESYDGTILELDGACVMHEPVTLSTVNPLPRGQFTSRSLHALSPTERANDGRGSGLFVEPVLPLALEAMIAEESTAGMVLDGPVGYDCPIRAGPNGTNLCTWPPRRDISGFPSLARVKEHVGSHGLLCRDCDKVFSKPTRYRDHRHNKVQTGTCSEFGKDKSKFPKHLTLPADSILTFFARPSKELSEQDAWLNGYKILHPGWEHDGNLPCPFYADNIANQQLLLVQETHRDDLGSVFQSSNSSQSQVGPSVSTDQGMHQDISPLTEEGADLTFDLAKQEPIHNMTNDPDFTQALDDLTWGFDLSGSQHFNNVLEAMEFTMSSAFSSSMESNGGQGLNISSHPTELDFSNAAESSNITRAAMATGDQPYSAHTDGPNLAKELSLRTSMLSREPTSNPSWQVASCGVDQIDSTMELCDTPDSLLPGVERSTGYPTKSLKPRGICKHPGKSTRTHPPALQSVLNQVKRLRAQIEKLTAQADQLYSETDGLKSGNRLLHIRIGEVESEKEALLSILRKIRREIDAWELDDGESLEFDERMTSLTDSMRNIKLLLPN